jgi:hypothetical protein
MVPGCLDQEPANMFVAGLHDLIQRSRLARGVLAGDQPDVGADAVLVEAGPVPISTANANPVRVEISRKHPRRCTTSVHAESAASSAIRHQGGPGGPPCSRPDPPIPPTPTGLTADPAAAGPVTPDAGSSTHCRRNTRSRAAAAASRSGSWPASDRCGSPPWP